ncbi:ABC transporter ATP-binding protein [Paenibacillus marchantiophytorum]|uniref:ABC transporter ATP-binding protein n=1 Tax=Paenibacillus marchantiophytorum TaxID=1619310 RepID=A0ABQ1EQJ8_9BACL|nr:ABC transporter ATP-binding protein [Paenibacillus marchantiophytorum]GFZ82690.1 ABC transporter ATP-binding protein [Paenibacillus marchantiophytorum]
MSMAETVVEMRGITKKFPGIVANDDISFSVKKGEIHALLGENGAGKSTLMNILFGLYEPDEGQILIRGNRVKMKTPNDASRLGIGMVHQHFMLIKPFTVTENIILGSEPYTFPAINKKEAKQKVNQISQKYGLAVDPNAKISDITVGMEQRVEILKTLYRGADILIFDEPTAVLTPQEIEELLKIMKNLVREGKTIILITHKLKEIMAVCDHVTIIRRGKVVGSVHTSETSPAELAAKMVGKEVSFEVQKKEAQPGQAVLEVTQATAVNEKRMKVLNEINLEVKSGEIVGIAGVDGNGQSELIEAITGLRKITSGQIILKGKDITNKSARAIIETGMSHIPEDRHRRGLVLDFSIGENMVLETYYKAPFSNHGMVKEKEVFRYANRLFEEYDVRTPSAHVHARSLSGGNQQKAIIAREIDKHPDLLIAAQPTRGVDVGAIEFIHKRLVEQRDKGTAVLLVSFELDEVMQLSDRIAVIYEGKIVAVVDAKHTSEKELGYLMAGGKIDKAGDSHATG